MNNILVTGVGGLIGSNFADFLIEKKNINVIGIDNFSGGYRDYVNNKVKLIEEDLTNYDKIEEIFIHVASFYSFDTAKFLEQRIIKEVTDLDIKKLKIKKMHSKETQVILGPYNSVNLLKNDYIKLQNFGFEELNIFINE